MYHVISQLRPHRILASRPDPVMHEEPAESMEEAVSIVKRNMRDNYADPVSLQNEDRSVFMDREAFMAEVNK